ncbi:MAG TPA: tetratricopeptide repeat protein [Pyrinomonadaceae bacterium]|nr:tetratricopeptide repeat protein [Pyrinomonadaceae bacterium]HMP66518.1 tetratricopeptide repeat protein [Pyrinomonadaceae bacterium]
MRKKYIAVVLAGLFAAACSTDGQDVAQVSNAANGDNEPVRSGKLQSTIEHTTENQAPKPAAPANGGRWSASGDPIDTTEFDKAIADAEKQLKAKPADADAKEAAATAYFNRGFALTEARQYASALGDYRRAMKLDPNHAESKKWESEIIRIYEMMNKEYPKPGEEPPPLPFKKV